MVWRRPRSVRPCSPPPWRATRRPSRAAPPASCPCAASPSRASAARTGSTSIRPPSRRDRPAAAPPRRRAPSTTISWSSARRRPRSRRGRSTARNYGRCRLPSAPRGKSRRAPTATPSALAARDRPMDFSVSRVATPPPRRSASAMRSVVSSGHLICTKCTSSGDAESRIRHRPQHALGDEVDLRQPPELLRPQRRRARAPQRQRPPRGGSRASRASSTRKCGLSAPSVPPDITRQTCRPDRPRRAPARQTARASPTRARNR